MKLQCNIGLRAWVSPPPVVHVMRAGGVGGFVMEWVPQTLQQFLSRPRSPEVLQDLWSAVRRGLRTLRAHGFIHGDLKWDNMGLSATGKFMFTDFGLSGFAPARFEALHFAGLQRSLSLVEHLANRCYLVSLMECGSWFSSVQLGDRTYRALIYGSREVQRARRTGETEAWGEGGFTAHMDRHVEIFALREGYRLYE